MVGGSKNTKLFILLKKNFLTSALTVEPFVPKILGTILVKFQYVFLVEVASKNIMESWFAQAQY